MRKITYSAAVKAFPSQYIIDVSSGCWQWVGSVTIYGYGRMRVDAKNVMAHRFSYELHVGKIPEGLFVCHKCDNRKCVNPEHLFVGEHQDNMTDMVKKNRQAVGSRNGNAVLSENDVLLIRASRDIIEQKELAKIFGCSQPTVSRIQLCQDGGWKHV